MRCTCAPPSPSAVAMLFRALADLIGNARIRRLPRHGEALRDSDYLIDSGATHTIAACRTAVSRGAFGRADPYHYSVLLRSRSRTST